MKKLLLIFGLLWFAVYANAQTPAKIDTAAIRQEAIRQFAQEIPVTHICGLKHGKVIYVQGYIRAGINLDSKHNLIPSYVIVLATLPRLATKTK